MKVCQNRLKDRGFKWTPRRQGMIELFMDSQKHLTPKEVWYKLAKRFDRCGLPGVYRNLESLVACGVLTRIQQFDRKKHYGLCAAKSRHHHHITCVRCGRVEDIEDCSIGHRKKIKGYKILDHFMQVNGVCAKCLDEGVSS